jgi:hypothetical protein
VKTIFVHNKYYQGNSKLGPTSSWELIWKAFLTRVSEDELTTFNPDEFGLETSEESDAALKKALIENQIEQIVMIFHKGIGWHRDFVGIEALSWIKSRNIRIVAIWGDIQIPDQRRQVKLLSGFTDLNLMTASHAAHSRFGSKIKKFYSWVPLGYDKQTTNECTCKAKVSFAGSLKNTRAKYIEAIQMSGVLVHIGGGEGTNTLSRDEYLRLVAHPISISFAGSRIEPLVNARTFEVISQGVLLLEQWGRETPKFLTPYEDYVPWFNTKDLIAKAKFYSENTAEADRIAKNGKMRFESFADEDLWAVICGKKSGLQYQETMSFTRENFRKTLNVSKYKEFQYLVLDILSSSEASSIFFNLSFSAKSTFQTALLYRRIILRKMSKLLK